MQKSVKSKVIKKTISANTSIIENENSLTIKDIEYFYFRRKKTVFLYGLEYERLSLNKETFLNSDYESISTIVRLFATISKWDILYDENTIIGAIAPDSTSISLEPGCQLEISIAPKRTILEIDIELTKITNLLNNIAKPYNIIFLGYGTSPKSSTDSIQILNKKRYQIMNEYLPNCKNSELCTKMMRQTAGIQVNIDYSTPKDAHHKLKFLNMISPFMAALFANCPIENNRQSEFKSTRINTWLHTGENRCGIFYKEIFENEFFKYKFNNYRNIFKKYIEQVIKIPMVYIVRNGKNIPIEGALTFEEFMKDGCLTYRATMEDYILHQSLCFPNVRLKKYIEIRNHDSQDQKTTLALCAFYKGLMQNNISLLLCKFNFINLNDIDYLSSQAAKHGLDFEYKKYSAWHIVAQLFTLSLKKLDAKERIYLKPIQEMLRKGKTNSDIILDLGIEKVSDLIEFLK